MTAILGTTRIYPGDSPGNDAFSRLRMSQPLGLFSAQCQYDTEPLQMEGVATGTGVAPAHDANTRMVALVVNAGTGASIFQSYEYIPYQPGKSQLVEITGTLTAGVALVVVDVGIGDANNGIFYRQNGATDLRFVRRSATTGSVVDTPVIQSAWNIDKFDGTGPSKLTIDPTAGHIVVFDMQYLGMGRVRCGFSIDGQIFIAHEFRNANSLAVPYMQTLNLPIHMSVTATASAGAKTAYFKCAAVASEGGADAPGYQWNSGEQIVTAGNETRTSLISVRPFLTFNLLTNRQAIKIHSIEVQVTGANPVKWELAIGSTFSAGPTWPGSAVHAYSGVEATTAPGTLSAVGYVIEAGYAGASSQSKGNTSVEVHKRIPLVLNRAGANTAIGTATLIVTGCTGASVCRGSINYSEVR